MHQGPHQSFLRLQLYQSRGRLHPVGQRVKQAYTLRHLSTSESQFEEYIHLKTGTYGNGVFQMRFPNRSLACPGLVRETSWAQDRPFESCSLCEILVRVVLRLVIRANSLSNLFRDDFVLFGLSTKS